MTIKIECPAKIKKLHIEFFDDDFQEDFEQEEIPKLRKSTLNSKPPSQSTVKQKKEEFLDFSSGGSSEVSQEVVEKPKIEIGERPVAVASEMNQLEL